MIEKYTFQLKKKLKQRKSGFKILFFNVIGNFLIVFINFWLPFKLDVDTYSEFVVTFSFFVTLTTILTFGLNSLCLKYSCLSFTNLRNVIFLSWLIYLVPAILICIILYFLEFHKTFFNYNYIDLIKILIGASITSFQRISLSFFVGRSKLNSYGFSILNSKGVLSFLIIFSVIYDPDFLIKSLPNIFLIHGFFNLLFIIYSGFFPKFNKITFLKSLSLTLENKFLFFNIMFQSFFSGYGLTFFLSPIMRAVDIGLLNIFNQINNVSVFITNGLNEGYLKSFLNVKKISNISINNFVKYINTNNIFILIPLLIISTIYLYLSTDYYFGIFILPVFFIIIMINPFKSIYYNVLIFYKNSKIIFFSSVIYYLINILFAYYSYTLFGFNMMIVSLCLCVCVYIYFFKTFFL